MSINHLEARIIECRNAYYAGVPVMSDAEYDALEAELRRLDPDNKVLAQVGAPPQNTGWEKVRHGIPMGSLDKVQNAEEFAAWVSERPKEIDKFVVTDKLDGLSIELKYVEGRLVSAVTRGDGTVGEDITRNVVRMRNVVTKLTMPYTGYIRGEILLLKDDWKLHFPDLKNPRNAAAGIARRYDGAGAEFLTVLCFDIKNRSGDDGCGTYTQCLTFIQELGLVAVPSYGLRAPWEIALLFSEVKSNRDKLAYDIDGMVVRYDDAADFASAGYTDMRPRGAIAYKFPPEMAVTTIKDVTWQLGRTKRLTPVAELEPVTLCGVTISRVTLHTAANALKMQAGPGARVMISRRNDVIPYVEKVLGPSGMTVPFRCPACDELLDWDGEYLICANPMCAADLRNAIAVWATRLNILQWGDAFICGVMGATGIRRLSDIYTMDWVAVAEHVGLGVATRARKELDAHRTVRFQDFISALNIRHCDTVAKELVGAGIDTPEKLVAVTAEQLLAIDGIGEVKAAAIANGVRGLKDEILELAKHLYFEAEVSETAADGKLTGKSFCFTGASSKPRKELHALVEANGGEVKTSVGKGLTFLVMAEADSTSSKAQRAAKLGTQCISEADFLAML